VVASKKMKVKKNNIKYKNGVPISQRVPLTPVGHAHEKPEPDGRHVPPFTQGPEAQGPGVVVITVMEVFAKQPFDYLYF